MASKKVQETYGVPLADIMSTFFPDSQVDVDSDFTGSFFDPATKTVVLSFRAFSVDVALQIPKKDDQIDPAEPAEPAEPEVP